MLLAAMLAATLPIRAAEPLAPGVFDLPDRPAPPEPNLYGYGPSRAVSPQAKANYHLDLSLAYQGDYVFRGLDRGTALNSPANASFLLDSRLTLDVGDLPKPFIGLFANIVDSDPDSNFQEIRPILGAEWDIGAVNLSAGNTFYLLPDRDDLNTSEAWFRIALKERLLSPYLLTAYDYDRYNGWYIEAGISHDFAVQDTGLVLTPSANVAYVASHGYFASLGGDDTGFQHYEFGLTARYTLNRLLNIPERLGQWTWKAYLFYTDGLDNDLRSTTGFWGGTGIEWRN